MRVQDRLTPDARWSSMYYNERRREGKGLEEKWSIAHTRRARRWAVGASVARSIALSIARTVAFGKGSSAMPLLTCPQCGSAVTALATETTPLRCPVCGAALSLAPDADAQTPIEAIIREHDSVSGAGEEDDSATRAVAPERMEPLIAQVRTDHQLRQDAAGAAGVDETTRALPGAALVATEPAAPVWPGGHEATQALPISALPPEEPQPQRTLAARLRPLSIALAALTLVAVIVLAALASNGVLGGLGGFGSAAPTATVAPAAISTPAVTPFSVQGLYQLSFPQGWNTQQRNNAPHTYYALLSAPTGGVSVNIAAQQADSSPTPVTLDQQYIGALTQPGTSPVVANAPTSVTIGGQAWVQLTADVTLKSASGQPTAYAHVAALSAQRHGYLYTIVCVATSSTPAAAGPAYTTAQRVYFQPLLASFSFLN